MALQVFYKKKLHSSDVAIAANISFFKKKVLLLSFLLVMVF
jgi:hypothetical protein